MIPELTDQGVMTCNAVHYILRSVGPSICFVPMFVIVLRVVRGRLQEVVVELNCRSKLYWLRDRY